MLFRVFASGGREQVLEDTKWKGKWKEGQSQDLICCALYAYTGCKDVALSMSISNR